MKKLMFYEAASEAGWPDWVIVYFGHRFENYRTSTNFWAAFSMVPAMY
jgi:hypothetical protein